MAPGIGINSLASESFGYKKLSGTSMAVPVVAGCIALLYEKHHQITPLRIKEFIMSNATDLDLEPNRQGSGLLNIEKIIETIKKRPPEGRPDDSHTGNDVMEPFLSKDALLVILLVIIILNL